MLIGSILIEIILCIIIFFAKQKKWQIEKILLVLGLSIGVMYVFALPIGRAPDEESHFFRAYEISTGHFISSVSEDGAIGSLEPSEIEIIRDFKNNNVKYSEIIANSNLYPNEENQSFIVTSAYNYNIFSYLPQVVGIWIGRILHLPLITITYLAKLINLIICILILYFSIKYIPFLKETVLLLAFLPVTMQAMTSFSPDGIVITTATALISFILYSIYSYFKPYTKKHFTLLFVLCLFLSMSKIAYAPLCLLLFAIPKERFITTQKKYFSIIGMGIIIFLILLIWLIIAPSTQSVSDSSLQISTIINNPLKYLATLVHSVSLNANLYLSGLFGGYLEWFNITLSPLYIFSTFTIFIIICNKSSQKYNITKSFKVLSILVSALLILITFTTMFIHWTKVGETIIDGVQGRYFLPILLLIPTWFLSIKKQPKKSNQTKHVNPTSATLSLHLSQNYYLYAFLIFESVYAVTSIVCTHL